MSNPGLEIRGGPGHPDPEMEGGGVSQFGLKIRGRRGPSTGSATTSIGLINEFLFTSLFKGNSQKGGCTPLYGLYRDVPLDRVWLLTSLS